MDFVSILTYFGITAANITPLVIVGGIGMIFVFKHTKPTRDSIDAIKINITAISGFLATKYQDSFPSNLLKTMSPYQIQKDGYTMLKESGFEQIFDSNKDEFFSCVNKQKPKTRLDVENFSIICYGILLNKDFMNPIKTYLYDHPTVRGTYPVLAGVYIRDKYLAEHPEITQ